ncbi:MAG: AMIN domain-containing protein [candidate division WOR-3 bacterium]
MKRFTIVSSALTFLAFGFLCAQNMITSYSVSESPEGINIVLEFTDRAPQYRHFTLSNPPRVVVDLMDVGYSLGGKVFMVGKGGVERIRGAQYQREPQLISRIVLDVDGFRSYSISEQGNKIIIKVGPITDVPYSTEKVEESIETVAKKQEQQKAQEPQAKLQFGEKYFYSSRGKKDPFKPEVMEEEEELLNVSEAKLLGIIRSEEGNVALLQDRRGVGYVLKEGDRVRNGRVVRIESDRVVFATVDFGFTRRIELKLEEEKK